MEPFTKLFSYSLEKASYRYDHSMDGLLGLWPGTASVAKGYRYPSKPDEKIGHRYDQSNFDCWDVCLEGLLVRRVIVTHRIQLGFA